MHLRGAITILCDTPRARHILAYMIIDQRANVRHKGQEHRGQSKVCHGFSVSIGRANTHSRVSAVRVCPGGVGLNALHTVSIEAVPLCICSMQRPTLTDISNGNLQVEQMSGPHARCRLCMCLCDLPMHGHGFLSCGRDATAVMACLSHFPKGRERLF